MSVKENVSLLKEDDVFSMALFTLYALKNDEKYSSLSELAYLLDKKSLLNLLEYYGGQTITIPTSKDLEQVVSALSMHLKVHTQGMREDEAIESLGVPRSRRDGILATYDRVENVIRTYAFAGRADE